MCCIDQCKRVLLLLLFCSKYLCSALIELSVARIKQPTPKWSTTSSSASSATITWRTISCAVEDWSLDSTLMSSTELLVCSHYCSIVSLCIFSQIVFFHLSCTILTSDYFFWPFTLVMYLLNRCIDVLLPVLTLEVPTVFCIRSTPTGGLRVPRTLSHVWHRKTEPSRLCCIDVESTDDNWR